MPQTIAMQRGTSTVASANATTLWTQSGGTATRVIFNGMGFRLANTGSNSYIDIVVVPSGGAPYVIAKLESDRTSWQFQAANNPYSMNTSPNSFGDVVIFRSNSAGTYTGDFATIAGVNYVQDASNQGTGLPLNFWIGPSDAIVARFQNNASQTATFGWSFTTITES